MSAKLTPWFSAKVKPVHIGEYEYEYESGYSFRAFWDGIKFTIHDKNFPGEWGKEILNPKKNENWRGLAEKP